MPTDFSKLVVEAYTRLKHIPGRHDQDTHGNRGGDGALPPLKWKMPGLDETDYIIPDENSAPADRQFLTVSNTEKWARNLEDYGWDVQTAWDESIKSGSYPQLEPRNYSPDWGTHPGVFTAYRVGSLEKHSEGDGIFFGPNEKEIKGYDFLHPESPLPKDYELTLTNPYVAENKTEIFKAIFPEITRRIPKGSESWSYYHYIQAQTDRWLAGVKKRGGNAWEKGPDYEAEADAKMARKLRSMGYDSFVLTRPARPCTREICKFETDGIVEIGSEKELRPYARVVVLGADATLDADGWHASKKNVEKLLRTREPRGEYVPDIVRWRLDSAIGLGAKVKKLNLPEQEPLVEGVVY